MLDDEELLETIKASLITKNPLSIVRYGDGEAVILNGFKDTNTFKSILKRQLGYIPAIDEAEQIRENLISAYTNCDIIGVPSEKIAEHARGYWGKSLAIFNENIHTETPKLITSIDAHSHFLDKNYYKELMQDVEVVNYISCRNIDEGIKRAFNVKRVNSYIIAPEMKFDNSYTGPKHYPEQFNRIKKWMEKAVPVEGNLCLVGAGFVGKIYNNWFKELGGVSFDIGSIFDSWAGLVTRGPERGTNVFDETYKL